MANPKLYLFLELTEASIRDLICSLKLPDPESVRKVQTIAEYHIIYDISFPSSVALQLRLARPAKPDVYVSLILRVSSKHLPRINTLNEVAVMSWVRETTKVPIPAVIAFDASEDNPIRHEFTLLEKALGVSVDNVYSRLDDAKNDFLVSQLTEYLIDIHRHDWHHAGGLTIDYSGVVVPGRVLVETFWQAPEINEYWGPDETVDTLNPTSSYGTYTNYLKGHMEHYIRNIQKHGSLEWMRGLIPRLESFNSMLDRRACELNDTRCILTHKDLYFGNIMCDPETAHSTAILDWEFSAVLPLPLWNPGGGLLWNGKDSPAGLVEQKRLYKVSERLSAERDPALLQDFETKPPHDAIKDIFNYVRGIVEVYPRGQKAEAARSWKHMAEEALRKLKV